MYPRSNNVILYLLLWSPEKHQSDRSHRKRVFWLFSQSHLYYCNWYSVCVYSRKKKNNSVFCIVLWIVQTQTFYLYSYSRRSTSESEIIYFKKIVDKSLIFFSKQKQCGWGWRMGPRVPDWLGGVYDRNGPHYSFTATDLLYRGQATSQKYICHRRKYLCKTFSKLQY